MITQRRNYTKTCAREGCEEEFRPWNSLQKYCSTACSNKGSAPSPAIKRLGGAAIVAVKRAAAGIPEDAPKNKHGQSCKEKECEVCGETFLAQWSTAWKRKTCSHGCAAEQKRGQHRDRKGKKNPNFKHGKRAGVRDREGERRWYAAFGSACQHPSCSGSHKDLVLHHVLYAQEVRRRNADLFDPRNSMTLCVGCHSSHHQRGTYVIPLSALSEENLEFANEVLGEAAEYYLARRYRVDKGQRGNEDPHLPNPRGDEEAA